MRLSAPSANASNGIGSTVCRTSPGPIATHPGQHRYHGNQPAGSLRRGLLGYRTGNGHRGHRRRQAGGHCYRSLSRRDPPTETATVPVRHQRPAYLDVPAHTKMTLKRPNAAAQRRSPANYLPAGELVTRKTKPARRPVAACAANCRRCGKCVTICKRDGGRRPGPRLFILDHPHESDFRYNRTALHNCGACAANCPTGAMRIETVARSGSLTLRHYSQPATLVFCATCGAVIGTERYLAFIRGRLGTLVTPPQNPDDRCATFVPERRDFKAVPRLCHQLKDENKENYDGIHKGQMVRVLRRSTDESWEDYMDGLVGSRGSSPIRTARSTTRTPLLSQSRR